MGLLQNKKRRQTILLVSSLLAVLIILLLAAWTYILLLDTPISRTFVAENPWPIACSSRGCVTTKDWARQLTVAEKFSALTGTPTSTPSQALTTTIRQHLLTHASLKSPTTLADAHRYREEVLKLTDEQFIQSTIGLSGKDYDQFVVLPFLQQEALRQSGNKESTDELYKALSKERFIFLFSWNFTWDKDKAEVVQK